ncbi:MAG TPA: FecR family protein [Candidatus Limnocylindria bacterium]|nr:FecR family protein [Candidatus Limnocylindria bacterium]
MKRSKRLVAMLIVLLVVVGGGAYLYFPRGESLSAAVSATLAVLNTDITAQRGATGDFAPALDGDLFKTGDVVKSSQNGRAVLTFFDGSTLTVDPGSVVRVASLNRLDDGGIQAVIEQTLGRTWASVSKLKTADSKFEIKTPTSTAAVRGTAFETNVQRRPDGSIAVTYTADDGQLLVTAAAGGQTIVTPNTQVEIAQNQPAPQNPTPLPPQPTLRVTSSTGVGFAVTSPGGATCGSAGNKAEIFGCLQNGNTITIRQPVAGRYSVLMTAAAPAQNATVMVEALLGTTVQATRTLTRTFALGDLVRSAFAYGTGTPQTVGAFDPAELVTSVCGAVGTGRVFSGGTLQERTDQLVAFGQANHNADVALVATEAELNAELARQLAAGSGGAPVTGAHVTIDPSGLHFSGDVSTPIGAFTAAGDASMGPLGGRLAVHIRNLTAGPIPGAILDQVRATIEQSASGVSDSVPFTVRQVALRSGCFAIMGTTR